MHPFVRWILSEGRYAGRCKSPLEAEGFKRAKGESVIIHSQGTSTASRPLVSPAIQYSPLELLLFVELPELCCPVCPPVDPVEPPD